VLVRLRQARIARGQTAADTALEVLIAEPETQFDAPKWSPDGRTIAVERHRTGALPEIVLVDVATRAVRVVASDAGTRFVMPAWRPDGGAIVAAGRAGR
jgi:Tol biopolymer transport system component